LRADAPSANVQQTPAMSDVRITTLTDGPLEVDGEVSIVAPDGTVIRETSKAYLCRCGHSGNKPFCDGSHKREGWTESSS
jgi:hypothetical protein